MGKSVRTVDILALGIDHNMERDARGSCARGVIDMVILICVGRISLCIVGAMACALPWPSPCRCVGYPFFVFLCLTVAVARDLALIHAVMHAKQACLSTQASPV